MKKMVYKAERDFEILCAGSYREVPFWVVSYGTHPCVYVDATQFKDILGADLIYSSPVYPHGGITYDEDRLRNVWDEAFEGFDNEEETRRIIGWDYCHLGDYDAISSSISSGKKWTTDELVKDAKITIDELHYLKDK